ncbi:MAG: hypothetical protein ABIQ39_12325, partial [Ilumatobacteraceae bacterium]
MAAAQPAVAIPDPAMVKPASASANRPTGIESVQPERVLDTRSGIGGVGPVQPGTVLHLDIAGPQAASASAVVLNLTATEASGEGWVKAWPCGQLQPATSVLNFVPGRVSANAVVVQFGPAGVCLSTFAPVQLVADLSGWFTGSSDFSGISPNRILDTRGTGDPLTTGTERRVHVADTASIPVNAGLVALNVTVVADVAGWVVAYPCGQSTQSSTVTFAAGEVTANLTFVGLANGDVCLRSYSTADLVLDTYGWASGAGGLQVQAPQRLLDTRTATWPYGHLQNGSKISLRIAGVGGVANDAAAALLTITATNTSGDGFVTAWPCDQTMPRTSTVNTMARQSRSNLAFVKLAADGAACLQLYTSNGSPVDLVVDGTGWVTGGPTRDAPPPAYRPPSPWVAGGSSTGCVLSRADVVGQVAFCETFDLPHGVGSSRSGDLDPVLWGLSR